MSGDEQLDIFDAIADAERRLARGKDPATSKKGARDVRPRLGGQMALLLAAFVEHGPMTSFEAGERTGLAAKPGCCYWHRVSDLADRGYVERTGVERVMPTGSAQAEYRVTAAGVSMVSPGGASVGERR